MLALAATQIGALPTNRRLGGLRLGVQLLCRTWKATATTNYSFDDRSPSRSRVVRSQRHGGRDRDVSQSGPNQHRVRLRLGNDDYGQYGNGTTTSNLRPIEVYAPTGEYGPSAFLEDELEFHILAIVRASPEPSGLGLVIGFAGLVAAWRLRRAKSDVVPIVTTE